MLLTFLALMSGLAASPTPSAASVMDARAAVVSVVSPGVARVSAHVVAHEQAMVRPVQPAQVVLRVMPPLAAPVMVPVLVPVERALE